LIQSQRDWTYQDLRVQQNLEAARHFFNTGVEYAKSGREKEAAEQYQEALAVYPDYADAVVGLGCLEGNRGNTEVAIAKFREALSLEPGHVNATRYLAVMEKKMLEAADQEAKRTAKRWTQKVLDDALVEQAMNGGVRVGEGMEGDVYPMLSLNGDIEEPNFFDEAAVEEIIKQKQKRKRDKEKKSKKSKKRKKEKKKKEEEAKNFVGCIIRFFPRIKNVREEGVGAAIIVDNKEVVANFISAENFCCYCPFGVLAPQYCSLQASNSALPCRPKNKTHYRSTQSRN